MATYVQGQGSLPMPGNPAAVAVTVGAEATKIASDTPRPGIFDGVRARINSLLFGNGEPSAAARRAEAERQRNRMQTRVGTLTGEMYRPHLTQEQIADAEQIAKNPEELAQHLLSMTPVLGQLDSANTAINGHKFVSNEAATLGERIFNGATTSLAALPFIGVVVSNASKAKPLATITNRVDNLADGAKAASKAPKG